MIELIAHADNCWKGAYRLHMKTTGFLLGVGRDVKAVAVMRLLEEDMSGTFHVAFADGQPGMRGKAEALDWEAEVEAIKADAIAEYVKAQKAAAKKAKAK